MHSRILIAGAMAGAIAGAGCARNHAKLTPAPTAIRVSGAGQAAAATAAGVRVTAHTQAWRWDPPDLATKVTPMLLELSNNGDRAVIVRYNHISLMDDGQPLQRDAAVRHRREAERGLYRGQSVLRIQPVRCRALPVAVVPEIRAVRRDVRL